MKRCLADRAGIEFFDGPHSIHGVGTSGSLHRHLEVAKNAVAAVVNRL